MCFYFPLDFLPKVFPRPGPALRDFPTGLIGSQVSFKLSVLLHGKNSFKRVLSSSHLISMHKARFILYAVFPFMTFKDKCLQIPGYIPVSLCRLDSVH